MRETQQALYAVDRGCGPMADSNAFYLQRLLPNLPLYYRQVVSVLYKLEPEVIDGDLPLAVRTADAVSAVQDSFPGAGVLEPEQHMPGFARLARKPILTEARFLPRIDIGVSHVVYSGPLFPVSGDLRSPPQTSWSGAVGSFRCFLCGSRISH